MGGTAMLTLSDFAGEWRLSRSIKDLKFGQDGTLIGQATLTPDGENLCYCETGTLTLLSGAVMAAQRGYLWSPDQTGISVFFEDGSPFHRFDPTGEAIGSTHLCGADTYDVTYDFNGWPHWSATWRVTGPRKDYTSISHYIRP